MEKRIYQTPNTEQIYLNMSGELLVFDFFSLDKGEDDNEPGAKRNITYLDDDLDFLEDEDIEPIWSFNVWE